MEERFYAVTIETEGEIPDEVDDATDTLIEAFTELGALGSSVSTGGIAGGVGGTFSVEASDPVMAASRGAAIFMDACTKASIPVTEIVLLEVMHERYQQVVLEAPPPELVGVSEIAELLGVSRQRVGELRRQPGFPAPIAELRAGPVWSRPSLDRFLRSWPRKPGRPRDLRGAISNLHVEMLRSARNFQAHTRDSRSPDADAIMRPLRERYPEKWHDQAELQQQLDDLVREGLLELVPSKAVPRMNTYRLTPEAWRLLDEIDAELERLSPRGTTGQPQRA